MNLLFARFISFLLNPLVVLIFAPFFIIYRSTNDLYSATVWTVYSFVFLVAIGIFMIYAVRKKIFSDLDVSKREQRPLLFIVCISAAIFYIAGLFLFHAPNILVLTSFGMIIGIIIASIINTQIKASLHVATLSALIFSAAIVYNGLYLLLLLLIPLVGWARVVTKRHSLQETIIGGILGSLLSLGMYFALKMYYR